MGFNSGLKGSIDGCIVVIYFVSFFVYLSVEITNKMQPFNRIYYSKTYWSLNIFQAAYHLSSGAPNCICSLWFIYTCGDRPLSRLGGNLHVIISVYLIISLNKVHVPFARLPIRLRSVESLRNVTVRNLCILSRYFWVWSRFAQGSGNCNL